MTARATTARLDDDGTPFIQLDRYARGRISGNANAARNAKRGRFSGRARDTTVATDPPTPPVERYRHSVHCPRGCRCVRCAQPAQLYALQYAACAVFRSMAW